MRTGVIKGATRSAFLALFCVAPFLCSSFSVDAAPLVPLKEQYRTLRTEHFKIHFPIEQAAIARRVGRIAEEVHARLEPRFQSGAADTHIVLVFNSDLINAFATTYGMDRIILYMTGPEPDDFARYEDWTRQLIEHEYVHILTLRPYRGPVNIFFRLIVGLPPNLLTPDGLSEGYPVFEESRVHADGRSRGRLDDPQTLAIRDTLVLHDRMPSLEEAMTGTERWPYGAVPYLFGGRFVAYLRETCGHEAMDRFFLSYIPAFFPDWRMRSLDCGGMEEAYDRFVASEHRQALERLSSLSEKGVSPRQRLTFDGGTKRYLRPGPESPVYFAIPESRSSGLYSLDGLRSSLVYRSNAVNGFYLDGTTPVTSELRSDLPGSIYKNELHRQGRRLFDDEARREAPTANRSGIIAYIRRLDPFVELVQLIPDRNPSYSFWGRTSPGKEKVLLRLPMSYGMYQPAVSKGGDIAVVVRRPDSTRHSLVICRADVCEEALSAEAAIATPAFFDDASGTSILFASDIAGVFDIYSLSGKEVKRLTHSLTGFRSPLMTEGGLYVIGQAENGDEIFLVNDLVHDEVDGFDRVRRPFTPVPIDNDTLSDREYDPASGPEFAPDSEPYSAAFSFRPFLNGTLGGPLSYINAGLAGYDALSRHEMTAGVGLYDEDRSYGYASYAYRRLFPDFTLSFAGMPLDRDSPEYCGHYRNRNAINYCLGDRRFSFQESELAIDMLFEFRLLRNRLTFFAGRTLLRNSSQLSTTRYAYDNIDLGTVAATYQVYYFESYSRSISPEKGFFFEIEGSHHPAGWTRGYPAADGSKPVRLTYERYAGRFELFLPFFFDYHVPVLAGSISYLNGKDYTIQSDRLSTELPGLNPDLSPYGRAVQVWRFEYRFPIWQRRSRLIPRNDWFSLPSIGVRSLSLAPFIATGQAYEDIVYPDLWVNTAGVTLDMQLYAFYQPFSAQLTYARGDGEAGEGRFSLGFSVGARPASSHAPLSRPSRHPEYHHPTYSNR
ncbi:hypothetical protein [Leptonema illini]|uniref:WD40-like beta Propeller containing protein n=1 Tax=Leptonema illini DSM 21528 TaxID=929563 RepID=H2CIH1_9LEPT|nr:hypothetical protein [Leptonema illini]EHQ05964.1 hypothetical protein Lepil_1273 [Leptonema illini DSM 21528]